MDGQADSDRPGTKGQSMTSIPPASSRDYSLTGESARRAVEAGLAAAEWYHTDVPRKDMKALMARSDGAAISDTLLWVLLHIATP